MKMDSSTNNTNVRERRKGGRITKKSNFVKDRNIGTGNVTKNTNIIREKVESFRKSYKKRKAASISNSKGDIEISKKKSKRKKSDDAVTDNVEVVPRTRSSDEQIVPKVKWTNKQRLLIFACRGLSVRDKLVMQDLQKILPHSKKDNKKDGKNELDVINEIAELKKCNKCIYFLGKRKKDLYMWLANVPSGPSLKFLVQNHHTMQGTKLTGNSLVGSRPLLCFDQNFNAPHWALMKEVISQVFNVPKGFPKSQPFFDRLFVFSIVAKKINFRNYQIATEDGQLTEIGPRFTLFPIKIFDGSFGGETLWSNPSYVSPNQGRITRKQMKAVKTVSKIGFKKQKTERDRLCPTEFKEDPTSEFFKTKPLAEAEGREKDIFVKRKHRGGLVKFSKQRQRHRKH